MLITQSQFINRIMMKQYQHLSKCVFNKNISIGIQIRNNHFDIVIAGGGMVGTTLACALGKNKKLQNKKILLLEGAKQKNWDFNGLPQNYSNRVSSLNPGSQKLLSEIDAWDHIEKARFSTVKKMQVWDAMSEAMITFNNDHLENDVSYIVENGVLLSAVGKEVNNAPNVKVIYEAKIKEYQLPADDLTPVKINMENGNEYSCDLLLGCDGANSQVRQAMGVKYLFWNYNQKGLVATLKLCEENENNVAWQRFLPTGPIALLPLTKTLSSLVWSTTPEHAKCLMQLSNDEFVDQINEAFMKEFKQSCLINDCTRTLDNCLRLFNFASTSTKQIPPKIGECQESSRAMFPLGFGHSTNYIVKSAVVVGDAAHRIHPLAGQGVNLGFGDVACLSEILGETAYSGSKINNMNYLKRYETQRQRHNIPTMLAVDGLYRLYNAELTPIVILRSLGLQVTHALSPLKKAIMAQAAV